MPLEFSGVFGEYRRHRTAAVVWDASNLGSVRVSGPGARELVQRTFTNDLRRSAPGRTQYSFLLSETDAGIVDDLMVWWVDTELFLLTPNCPERVMSALWAVRDAARLTSCEIEDVSSGRVLLALQGAEASAYMADMAPTSASLPAFRVRETKLRGCSGLVATTRFGREAGFELHLAPSSGRTVYRLLLERGVTPAGLAMRETHRIEAGIPRYGYELGPGVSPLEAGFPQAVGFDSDFVGRPALLDRRRRGIDRILRTVVVSGRQIPRPGWELFSDGRPVGYVTSGNFSPRLHRGIGFAFVRPGIEPGGTVTMRTPDSTVDVEVETVPPSPRPRT